jgi:hypothetical protein
LKVLARNALNEQRKRAPWTAMGQTGSSTSMHGCPRPKVRARYSPSARTPKQLRGVMTDGDEGDARPARQEDVLLGDFAGEACVDAEPGRGLEERYLRDGPGDLGPTFRRQSVWAIIAYPGDVQRLVEVTCQLIAVHRQSLRSAIPVRIPGGGH